MNIINNKEATIDRLYVKYMVCLRDKMALQSVLNKLSLSYRMTAHGAIEFLDEITKTQYQTLKEDLSATGMILLGPKESMLIDRIINTIVEVIHYSDELPKLEFAELIKESSFSMDESIFKIFSDVKGMSILQFIVIHKIERAKELLLYDDVSLSEISELLNYKNQHFLTAQFKKITGLTPNYFKRLKKERLGISEQHLGATNSHASEMKM